MSGNSQDRRRFDRAVQRTAAKEHHGRDYLLAASALLAEAFAVIFGITALTLFAGIFLVLALESYTRIWRSNNPKWDAKWIHVVVVLVICSATMGGPIGTRRLLTFLGRGKKEASRPAGGPPVSLWVDCDFQGFPMVIPSGQTIHVLIAHPRIIERNDLLFDFEASNDKNRMWPSKKEAFPRPLNVGDRVHEAFGGEKCTVEKYGDPIVDNIALPVKFAGYTHPYVVVVDPLDSSNFKSFTFYMVNGCAYRPMIGQISSTASVHVLGEQGRETVTVNVPARKLYTTIFLGDYSFFWASPNLPPC